LHDAGGVEGERGVDEPVADELGGNEVAGAGRPTSVVDEVAAVVGFFDPALPVAVLEVDPGVGVAKIEAGRVGREAKGDGAAEGSSVDVLASGIFEGMEVAIRGLNEGGGSYIGKGGEPIVVGDLLLGGGVEAIALGYLLLGVSGLLGGVAVVAGVGEVGESGIPVVGGKGGLAAGVVADLGLLVPPLEAHEGEDAGEEGKAHEKLKALAGAGAGRGFGVEVFDYGDGFCGI
jgi:hypothetical protein